MRSFKQVCVLSFLAVAALATEAVATEICGNGADDDANSLVDEGCMPSATTGICESPLDCGDTGAVSPKTGSLKYDLPADIEINVPYGPKLTFNRFYTSQYAPGGGAPAYRKPMPDRWQHQYMSWLDKNTTPNPDEVVLHTTEGQDILFKYDSTASGYDYYVPQPGFHFKHLRQATSSPFKWELKTLTGAVFVYDWSSPTGKLSEVWDTLATPNKLTIAYDGNGQVSTITDAANKRRFTLGYTTNKLSSLIYAYYNGTSWTDTVTLTYGYSGSDLVTLNRGAVGGSSSRVHDYVYSSGYLTQVKDLDGNKAITISYASASPGRVVRTVTAEGTVGYEVSSPRTACSGSTAVYFNAGTTSCDDDSDCASGMMCGGETDPSAANTGACFYAGRCLALSSPNEDLVTTVVPIAPSGDTCEGACTSVSEYSWDTAGGTKVDLAGVKDPGGNWVSYDYDSNGMPTVVARGDSDNDPTNASSGTVSWMFYGNSSFPGRVTEVRRKSDKGSGSCSGSVSTDCKRTLYTWNSDGLLGSVEEIGFTLDSSAAWVSFSYTTSYTYDSNGRITQIDGPLSGSNDITTFAYYTTGSNLSLGYPKSVSRKKDSSNYLTTEYKGYDTWENITAIMHPDGTYTCKTFDSKHGYMTVLRESMNGQTDCSSNAADIVTSYVRDTVGRIKQVTRPDGGCVFYAYDSTGRLSTIKRRDDCNAASAGDTVSYTYFDGSLISKMEILDSGGFVTRRQEYTYWESSRLKTVKDPVSAQSEQWTYDARGLVSQVDAPASLGKAGRTYDAHGRENERRFYLDSTNYDAWVLAYASLRTPTSITDEDSKSTAPAYDDLARMVRLVTPDSGTTLWIYDAAGRVTTRIEADGSAGEQSHSFTYDNLGRTLSEDYNGSCAVGAGAEVQYVYDAPPVTCPASGKCDLTAGRLAYAKAFWACDATKADQTFDEETFYSYDTAGRRVTEYVRHDGGGVADHVYTLNKNGDVLTMTTPSGAVIGATYGYAGTNSDTDVVRDVWKTSTSTPIASDIYYIPFGGVAQYHQSNIWTNQGLDTRISRDLGYRVVDVQLENTNFVDKFRAAITRDSKGRVTARDYTGGISAMQDSYFLYDWQDRLLCERTTSGSTCPTTGTTLKNNINGSPAYTASNDRDDFLRAVAGNANYAHEVSLISGKDQVDYVNQSGTGGLGYTYFVWDSRGNRSYDDNTNFSHDRRDYTYDGRGNVITITGDFRYSGSWHSYLIHNAYDQKGRRVYKGFLDQTNSKQSQTFFYYDLYDRLTEVKYIPDIASPLTYSLYQLFWLGDRLVLYWQTDYPTGTVSRRYVHTDETGRPVHMESWPASGSAVRVWQINPDAWGNDTVVSGTTVFQPIVFAGQYRDPESAALRDDLNAFKPALIMNWHRQYDPWIGRYLQVDKLAHASADSYGYAANNPVGMNDPEGQLPKQEEDGQASCFSGYTWDSFAGYCTVNAQHVGGGPGSVWDLVGGCDSDDWFSLPGCRDDDDWHGPGGGDDDDGGDDLCTSAEECDISNQGGDDIIPPGNHLPGGCSDPQLEQCGDERAHVMRQCGGPGLASPECRAEAQADYAQCVYDCSHASGDPQLKTDERSRGPLRALR